MTREEAITILQEKYDYCKSFYDLAAHPEEDYPEMAKYLQALQIALTALRPVSREQVEKVWRGGWIAVRESEITGFNPELAGCDPMGGYKCSRCKAEAVLDCNDEFVLDNFCPHCGVPMTDEAVEMVLERLEAMKNGSTTD